jgi:peptidoglycan/xylan/chitin deacetylase (PgdA/CDA1 family)
MFGQTRKHIAVSLVIILGLIAFFQWASPRYVPPILAYHHVREGALPSDRETVSPQDFEKQMAYIHQHGYRVLRLEELAAMIEQNKPFPRHSVVLTFDDGYEDNYHFAYPILQKYGFPATIFMISDVVGTSGFLTWDQTKEMLSRGITVGAHTRRHRYLPDLTPEEQSDEIEGSKRILGKALGQPIEFFAYPVGGFNETIQALVKRAGYRAACTTNRGRDKRNRNVWELNRISMRSNNTQSLVLWAKLSGYYNLFRKSRNPY